MKIRICVIALAIALLLVSPSNALMEFIGKGPIGLFQGIPKELVDLANDEARVAASIGPIADATCSYVGDTARLNTFLQAFANMPETELYLQVYLHAGRFTLNMNRYDNTDTIQNIDWTMSVSQNYKGRTNAQDFGNRDWLSRVDIYLGGDIKLDTLDIPKNLEVKSAGEIEAFIAKHAEKQKQ